MKPKHIDRRLIARIQKAYAWSEKPAKGLPTGLHHHACFHWRNEIMAPLILIDRKATAQKLHQVETYFRRHPATFRYDSKSAYVVSYKIPYYDEVSNKRAFQQSGWVKSKFELHMGVWTKPLELKIPAGFEVRAGRHSNQNLRRDFETVMQKTFKSDEIFLKELRALHKTVDDHLDVIVIYNRAQKPVASGLAFTRGSETYLYCGSVLKTYEGRGLWRVLTAARQAVGRSSHPEHIWITSTANPRILGKGNLNFPIIIHTKALNLK